MTKRKICLYIEQELWKEVQKSAFRRKKGEDEIVENALRLYFRR